MMDNIISMDNEGEAVDKAMEERILRKNKQPPSRSINDENYSKVYDPRDGQMKETKNCALILGDILKRWGRDPDFKEIARLADFYDEMVDAGGVKRYQKGDKEVT